MKVMVIVKASKNCEAGFKPTPEVQSAMSKYNEDLADAGVLLSIERLEPSSRGKRVQFSGSTRSVTDGPFAETKELVGGYWLWNVKTMDEAVEWIKRAPFDGGAEVELRAVLE